MHGLGSAKIFLFEGFRLDRSRGGLFRVDQDGIASPVSIGSRAVALLGLLVERQGELISKDEIMELVWPGMVVEDGNLTVQISALRRILDQNREDGSCIQTVPRRGYRFVAAVKRVEPASPPISTVTSDKGEGAPVTENGRLQGPEAASPPADKQPAAASPYYDRLRAVVIGTVILAVAFVAAAASINWHSPWSGEAR